MEVPSYFATIYVGRRRGYDGELKSLSEVKDVIQKWVDSVGQCVTVTETEYIYTNGREPGIIVGFINYPRFPQTNPEIQVKALELANILLKECKQMGVSIALPEKTIWLQNLEEVERYQKSKQQ